MTLVGNRLLCGITLRLVVEDPLGFTVLVGLEQSLQWQGYSLREPGWLLANYWGPFFGFPPATTSAMDSKHNPISVSDSYPT